MTEIPQVHGHEIINLVAANPDGLSVAQIVETISKQFGGMPRFFTCSAQGMTLDELLAFLEERGKVRIHGESIYPGHSPACSH